MHPFPNPQIECGETLWLADPTKHAPVAARIPVVVVQTFIGKDERRYCAIEQCRDGVFFYSLVPALALAPAPLGLDFLRLMIEHDPVTWLPSLDVGVSC